MLNHLKSARAAVVLYRQPRATVYKQVETDPGITQVQIVPTFRVSRLLFPEEARTHCQALTRWYALRRHIEALISCLLEKEILRCISVCFLALILNFCVCMKGF
jgi:hypothetical protein